MKYCMVKPNANEVIEYHNFVVRELLRIIESITGIEVVYANPHLADVSVYIFDSEPELCKQYSEKFAEFAETQGVPKEDCEYLEGMVFSVIALSFMTYQH